MSHPSGSTACVHPEPWIMHLRYSVWPFKNVGAILGHANAAAYADNMHGCGKLLPLQFFNLRNF